MLEYLVLSAIKFVERPCRGGGIWVGHVGTIVWAADGRNDGIPKESGLDIVAKHI